MNDFWYDAIQYGAIFIALGIIMYGAMRENSNDKK